MTACSGCRELRKRCSQGDLVCPLRDAMSQLAADEEGVKAATASVSKCLGRKTFLDMIGGMPSRHRPALFKSLLYDTCGRYMNPVSGAVGILASGNWDLLLDMVDKVLKGVTLTPKEFPHPSTCVEPPPALDRPWPLQPGCICSPATPRENAGARDRIRSAILSGMLILEEDLEAEKDTTGKKSKAKKKTRGRLEGEDDNDEMTDLSSENLSATQGLEIGLPERQAAITRAVEGFPIQERKRHMGALKDDLGTTTLERGDPFASRNCASSFPRGSSCAESSNDLPPGSFSVNYDIRPHWADYPMADTKRAREDGTTIPAVHNSLWELATCLAHDKPKLNEPLFGDNHDFIYSSVPRKAIQLSEEACSESPRRFIRRPEAARWNTTSNGPELELFPGANRDSRPRDSGPPSSPTSGESVNIVDLSRTNFGSIERFQHSRQELSLFPDSM